MLGSVVDVRWNFVAQNVSGDCCDRVDLITCHSNAVMEFIIYLVFK